MWAVRGVPPELIDRLKAYCAEKGQTLGAALSEAIEQFLDTVGAGEPATLLDRLSALETRVSVPDWRPDGRTSKIMRRLDQLEERLAKIEGRKRRKTGV